MGDAKFSDLVPNNWGCLKVASNLHFNEKIKDLILQGHQIAHFGFGQSPFPIPRRLVETLTEFGHKAEYVSMKGIPQLRTELQSFHRKMDNLDLHTDGFVVGPGSKQIIYLIMATFNGDILIPSPGWTTYQPQSVLARKKSILVDSSAKNDWKISPEDLEKALSCGENGARNKILILTNPGNPTGTCYKRDEIKALSDICRRTSTIVLADEVYARLTFNGKHESFAKYYPEGTILSTSFSKCFSAGGWRLGYAHFPQQLSVLRDAVQCLASHTYTCAPTPIQYTVAKYLKENTEDYEEYFRRCRMVLKSVGSYCQRQLSEVGVKSVPGEASFYFIADFEFLRTAFAKRGITTGRQMEAAILEEADVGLMSGESFLRPPTEFTTRFCFVCFNGENILKDIEDGSLQVEGELTDEHIEKYCQELVGGVQRLKKWAKGVMEGTHENGLPNK